MGIDKLIRTISSFNDIRCITYISWCIPLQMNQEVSGWGRIFSLPCWVWIKQFSTFSMWGFRSLHSLSCFPNASSSFTLSCVNYPEKMRHTCQNNILLMKQEDVFSLLSCMNCCDFHEQCTGKDFITEVLARTEFAQLMCCHLHSQAQTGTGTPTLQGEIGQVA